jgi:enamine deaminase RidA (YjgF/YER057c/UK114 family)
MTDLPRRIPSPNGEVVLASQGDVFRYENFKFAASRRSGNMLYLSGVIAGPSKGEGKDVEAFKVQLRRAFAEIKATLAASGAGFDKVVLINTFHVWDGPNFAGNKMAQLDAFIAVKDEFMPAPHSAWTAVGTTGLAMDTGVVEIQMIAHL